MNVAITGMGVLSALGQGKRETLESLRSKRGGIGRMRHFRSVHTDLPVGEVPLSDREMKAQLGLPLEKEVSRTALMAMLAIGEALAEAGIVAEELSGKHVSLVSGTTVGGMDVTERHFVDHSLDKGDFSFFRGHDCGGNTEMVARHFGIFTETTTISTACSSASNAIMVGAEMLRNNEADIVVAGGTEALSLFHFNGFRALMIVDPLPCRPFCATRAGINLGEGAAYVVMEREEEACERGAHVCAYLAGWGNSCDAFHQTAMTPEGEGARLSMEKALEMAGLSSQDIDYVNAHGTGTLGNDQSETAALLSVFGGELPPVSSTKGMTGHATSASGGIESVICLLAMENHFLPANVGWQKEMEGGFSPTMGNDDVVLRHVMNNSFGFGGNDTTLIFSSEPPRDVLEEEEPCNDICELARVEITNENELSEIARYVKPLEARRMGRLLKASLLTSLKALEAAGLERPDAIVTATAYGLVDTSEHILWQLAQEGETTVSPTLFMQSTHNTLSSNIAIRTHTKGYNITYSHGSESLSWALRDARRLIGSGKYRTVLVGLHDESTPLLRKLSGDEGMLPLYSLAIVLSCPS